MTRIAPLNARLLIAAAAAAAALALSACGKQDDNRTAGQKLDSAVATAEKRTDQAKAEIKQDMAEAKASTEATADKLAQKMDKASDKVAVKVENAADKVAAKVADAAITASVNAELAKDDKLRVLSINVDTVAGAVLLRGTAPDIASRERASRLAAAVKGVTKVDNQLEVRG